MAYAKFDDPKPRVSQAGRKTYDSFPQEALRRALQSITNRVIWGGTGGTHATAALAGATTGGTAGLAIANPLAVVINGRYGTVAAQSNLFLPTGTQGSGTWVKYLIAAKFGGNATVVAGNEGTNSTTALLPDCPDGYVAVGYMEYNTTSGKYNRFGGGTAGGANVVSGNAAATCGTVVNFTNLMHMPLDEGN